MQPESLLDCLEQDLAVLTASLILLSHQGPRRLDNQLSQALIFDLIDRAERVREGLQALALSVEGKRDA